MSKQFRVFLFGAAALALSGRGDVNRVVVPARPSLATFNVRPEVNGAVTLSWDGGSERVTLPEGARGAAFKRVPRGWFFYADDDLLWRRHGPDTAGDVVVSHADKMLPAGPERDEYVQHLAPFAFEDGFMVAEGEALPQHWEVVRGEWGLSSVTNSFENPNRRGGRNERQPTVERSPNYYAATGRGAGALALTGEAFHDHYMLRASVQHNAGRNGIAFMAAEDGKFLTLTAATEPATERLVFELREHDGEASRVLDRVFTELHPGQWLLMEARVTDDEVRAFVDNIEILRVSCGLPPGGRYGLYADVVDGEPTRFDDVACAFHEDYALNTSEAMARATIHVEGFAEAGPRDARCWEKPEGVAQAFRLYGTQGDCGHLQSVRFLVREPGEAHTIGLRNGGYHFHVSRLPNGTREAKLMRTPMKDDGNVLLKTLLTGPQGKFTTLTLDTSREGEIRGFVDGKLVSLHFSSQTEMARGAAGIMARGRQAILHNTPDYTTLAPAWMDRVEKNTQYATDPFMRHWASPEGQWHINRGGETWLRGDTLGRIRVLLPATPSATLWLGLDETSPTDADACVELRDGRLTARARTFANPLWSVPVKDLPQTAPGQPGGGRAFYSVGLEDHVLWLSCETGMLAVASIPTLPRGRRVRLEGVPPDDLRLSRVRRENVFDSLFNESLHAWVINGGQWETVARFQCDPTWSHMNGENKDGLAALWGKYEFSGDFSVEFFAGMRMGWYERGGDLNITVMNPVNSPASGYTVVATGWDPDHSQTLSRLLRNGVTVTNTTAYAVPRNREGQARKAGYEPLVPGGRDMHGAWYGMRLRRVGNDLTYLFDNEPLMQWRDPDPLPSGGFGIWTFKNSMMVARARIVAESVKPRAFKFWRQENPAPAPAEPLPAPEGLRVGNLPPNLLAPAYWEPADPVSHPHVTYFQNGFRATATAAAGTFLTQARRGAFPAADFLGFDFEFAFAPGTLANFEFSSGLPVNGELQDPSEWSFPLTGTRDSRGRRLILPPPENGLLPSPDPEKPVWNRVTLWLPSTLLSARGHHIQLDGFGNLQPSDIQQGLCGNLPGAWYAVRNLRPVWNGVPHINAPGNTLAAEQFQDAARALPPGRLHSIEWPKEFSNPPLPPLAWAIPSVGEFELEAEPEPGVPGMLRVRSAAPWNSPLLPPQKAFVNDQPAAFAMRQNDALILIPEDVSDAAVQLDLTCADGRVWRAKVPAADPANAGPPRLVRLKTSAGKFISFNAGFASPIPAVGNAATAITPAVPGRGNVLTIANKGAFRRLDVLLEASYDPVATPLVQFGYAGSPSGSVTLSYGGHLLRFTENNGHASCLTPNPARPDPDVWNTFLTLPLGNLPGLRLGTPDAFALSPAPLKLASRNNPDNTGLWSSLNIDHIALGPALKPGDTLTLTPRYVSQSTELELSAALLSGNLPYPALDAGQRDALQWSPLTGYDALSGDGATTILLHFDETGARAVTLPSEPIAGLTPAPCESPVFTLADGVHHLLLRAADERGQTSEITGFPFFFARSAPAPECNRDNINPNTNTLLIRFASPPNLRNAAFSCDGAAVNPGLPQNALDYRLDNTVLTLNWPLTLRREIQRASNGDTLRLVLANVLDLNGNTVPALEIPFKMDYAADTTPPTLVNAIQRPAHIAAWVTTFNAVSDLHEFFQDSQVEQTRHNIETNGVRVVQIPLPPKNRNIVLRRNFPANRNNSNTLNLGEFSRLAISMRPDSQTLPAPSFKAGFVLRNPPPNIPRPTENTLHLFDVTPASEPRPGEWMDLIINLPAFFPNVNPADLNIESLALRVNSNAESTSRDDTLSIRAIAIYGAPDTSENRADILVDAYDASGIAGLKFLDADPSAEPVPARLRPDTFPPRANPSATHLFRPFQILDRAGNKSPIYFLPEVK